MNRPLPFYMIRHGETGCNAEDKMTGQLDISLTDKGRQQARKAADVIRKSGVEFDCIICSDLARSVATGDIIRKETRPDIPLLQDRRLREQAFGAWEGQPRKTVHALIKEVGFNPPGGETARHMTERVRDGITENLNAHRGKPPLFVTHAGVFRALGWAFNLSPPRAENCRLYRFAPHGRQGFPWDVAKFDLEDGQIIATTVDWSNYIAPVSAG